jgi:hypothetical protein
MSAPDPTLATKVARAELVKRLLILVTAIMVTAALVLLLVLLDQVRRTQETGTPIGRAILAQARDTKRAADNAQETNELILDCLDPKGTCYQKSQKQTGDVVASINEISQYAAVCADRPGSQSLDEIRRCIADLITASDTAPPGPSTQ